MIQFTLDELLKTRGWTAYKLSKESEIREDVIGTYRNNTVKRAVLAHLSKMCEVLECGVGDLMRYVPETKATKRGKKRP